MNDEKKLNEKKLDEKTLEEVTGGNSISDEYKAEEWYFIVDNCIGYCVYEGPGGCPYADKHAAYAARNPDGSCPGQKKHKDLM